MIQEAKSEVCLGCFVARVFHCFASFHDFQVFFEATHFGKQFRRPNCVFKSNFMQTNYDEIHLVRNRCFVSVPATTINSFTTNINSCATSSNSTSTNSYATTNNSCATSVNSCATTANSCNTMMNSSTTSTNSSATSTNSSSSRINSQELIVNSYGTRANCCVT